VTERVEARKEKTEFSITLSWVPPKKIDSQGMTCVNYNLNLQLTLPHP